jgi:hypothetical protein
MDRIIVEAGGLLLKPSDFANQTLCAEGARGYDSRVRTDLGDTLPKQELEKKASKISLFF